MISSDKTSRRRSLAAEKFRDLIEPIARSSKIDTAQKYDPADTFWTNAFLVSELSEMTEILPHGALYLSGASPVTADHLIDMGITGVVCALSEREQRRFDVRNAYDQVEDMKCCFVQMQDSDDENIETYFEKACAFVHEELLRGGRVLVHCAAGVSRSATLVIAYLIRYQNMSLRNAYALVKTCRRIVKPNNGFFRKLIQYEISVRGEASVQMMDAPDEVPDVVYEFSQKSMSRNFRDARCYG